MQLPMHCMELLLLMLLLVGLASAVFSHFVPCLSTRLSALEPAPRLVSKAFPPTACLWSPGSAQAASLSSLLATCLPKESPPRNNSKVPGTSPCALAARKRPGTAHLPKLRIFSLGFSFPPFSPTFRPPSLCIKSQPIFSHRFSPFCLFKLLLDLLLT
ncbi:hypothetical protein J3E68DRAFT_329412 [Trichoderma sp. SZMC 28012]